MRIAVASSGLGHVARGIETWARDTAEALAEQGIDVTLFAGAPLANVECGTRNAERDERNAKPPDVVVLPSLRRDDARARRLAGRTPGFAWRWQLKSGYGWEQISFWFRLWPRLRRGRFDILHVQDPMLAYWCRKFRRAGLVRTREILAHGTEESIGFLRPFDYVQHLAPWHLENAEGGVRSGGRQLWTAIPNFVDTDVFTPTGPDLRRELEIAKGAFVVGTVAAVKRHHKRIDYLIREFAAFAGAHRERDPRLVIAGARTDETDALASLADEVAPGRITILCDLNREKMPALYRTLDVFVLASLFEMMPIAVLEALASSRPVLAHRHPVLQWMIGEDRGDSCAGGMTIDMSAPANLACGLAAIVPDWIRSRGAAARRQAEGTFSKRTVVREYIRYYERICGTSLSGASPAA